MNSWVSSLPELVCVSGKPVIRDQTRVPRTGRSVLSHWAVREAVDAHFLLQLVLFWITGSLTVE